MVTSVNTDIFSVVWKSQREFTKNYTICDSSHTHFATQNESLKLSCLHVNGFYKGMRYMVYSRHFLMMFSFTLKQERSRTLFKHEKRRKPRRKIWV